jgi:DNA-binding MarR family transcriptional regulator
VEALFFAYRDFTSEPDRILHEIGFGRAHHRVLHFVDRYPGMRVADLLDILQITKQSLARVLRELIKKGYIAQQSGKADKRERLLYVTEKGAELARRLVAPQLDKINGALASVGNDKDSAIARFLEAMVSDQSRFPYKRNPRATGQGGEEPVGNL